MPGFVAEVYYLCGGCGIGRVKLQPHMFALHHVARELARFLAKPFHGFLRVFGLGCIFSPRIKIVPNLVVTWPE
jgi:hypothetical protein